MNTIEYVPFTETVAVRYGNQVLSSTVKEATQKDIDEAAKLHKLGRCPHNVVYDIPGYIYDIRNCYTCGAPLGLI